MYTSVKASHLRYMKSSAKKLKTKRSNRQKAPPKSVKKPFGKSGQRRLRIWWQNRHTLHKFLLIFALVLLLFVAQAYGVAFWYQKKHQNEPLNFGVSFIADYARHLELDEKKAFLALRDELGFKRFRLVSYWEDIEKSPGHYDFSELDWQFDRVGEVQGQVTLSIGLRQPRWPECHIPGFYADLPNDVWYPKLKNFMKATVERYKNRPELQSYQLENEYFLRVFGECKKYGTERSRLIDEFHLVKSIDNEHPIILSLANNYFGIPTGQPRADQFGISVYKRVFDYTVTKRYLEYPFPSWYYSWRSGLTEIFTGRSSMIHELQAEPWPPTDIKQTSAREQNESMDAKRLRERISYGKNTPFRDIDLWGGEWWYWRKTHFHDPSLWEVIKEEVTIAR